MYGGIGDEWLAVIVRDRVFLVLRQLGGRGARQGIAGGGQTDRTIDCRTKPMSSFLLFLVVRDYHKQTNMLQCHEIFSFGK